MEDSEIVKALECISGKAKDWDCDKCAFDGAICTSFVAEKALDLINRLQAENERLNKLAELGNMRANDYRVMRDRALKAEAENERLKPFEDKIAEFNSHIRVEDMLVFANSLEEWLEFCDNLKAEAYKEFAESVQGEIDDAIHSNYNAKEERQEKCKKFGIPIDAEDSYLMYCDGKIHALSGINSYIDNLLKELVGEDNASKN